MSFNLLCFVLLLFGLSGYVGRAATGSFLCECICVQGGCQRSVLRQSFTLFASKSLSKLQPIANMWYFKVCSSTFLLICKIGLHSKKMRENS